MTDTNLLKSKMAAAGDVNFVGDLAELLDCCRQTASKLVNGENEFSQKQIKIFAEKYNLTAEDIKRIFVGGD